MEAFQAAAANADFSKVQDFYLILTNQPGAKSWPITAATYMLLRKDYPADKNKAVLKFLDWALEEGSGPGQGARLRAAAGRRREADRRPLVQGNPGRLENRIELKGVTRFYLLRGGRMKIRPPFLHKLLGRMKIRPLYIWRKVSASDRCANRGADRPAGSPAPAWERAVMRSRTRFRAPPKPTARG